MKNIEFLLQSKKWEDFLHFSLQEIANELGFKSAMIVAYKLLYNEKWNEDLQEFAVELLYFLKNKHPNEWNLDWKCNAFLGTACDITLKYDERYEAYKQAYDNCLKPPPELLIELARCCYIPGAPPLSYEQAIDLLKKSITEHPYKQAATLLKSIYVSKKDLKNETYWSDKIEQIQDKNLPGFEPAFIKDV